MADEHTHAGSAPHAHEGDTPGHAHDTAASSPPPAAAPVAAPATTAAAVDVGPGAGGLSARILLTLLGAAAIIVGAFLDWYSFDVPEGAQAPSFAGTKLKWSIFYSTGDPGNASFFTSAGFVAIVLGLLALLGLALRTGWLTRLAGVLAIIAIVAYAITLYRVPALELTIGNVGLGAWVVLGGGLIVLVAGFLGSRRVVSATVPAA